jgi:hypothetical protein
LSLGCIYTGCDKIALHPIRAWRSRRLVIHFFVGIKNQKKLLRLTRRSLDSQFDSWL